MNQIVKVSNNQALARVGAPEEREYLTQIMAEMLGIPGHEANRPDVIALLGNAAQRNMQYGWIPGVHMHVTRYKNKEASAKAKRDVYNYTLVDGEKAWKDSLARWRMDHGVIWRYQRKTMSRQELETEVRLYGYTDKIPSNAFGVWSRILIVGEEYDDDNPMWSAGIWFGKMKIGRYWNDDSLPTGASSRDVALRRADKRAAMQCGLPLIPLDSRSETERADELTDMLRSQAQHRRQIERVPNTQHKAIVEDDGDMLFAASDNYDPADAYEDGDWSDSSSNDEDVQFYSDDGEPDDTPQDEPAPTGARLENSTGNLCPHCHAPAGKPHTKNCPTQNGARLEKQAEKSENPVITFALAEDSPLSQPAIEMVQEYRLRHQNSPDKMTLKMYNSLRSLIPMALGDTDNKDSYKILLQCLCGEDVDSKNLPGQDVGVLREIMIDPDNHKGEAQILQQILTAAYYAQKEQA